MSDNISESIDSKVRFRTILRTTLFRHLQNVSVRMTPESLGAIASYIEASEPIGVFYGGWDEDHCCGKAGNPVFENGEISVDVEIDLDRLPASVSARPDLFEIGVNGKLTKYEDNIVHQFRLDSLVLVPSVAGKERAI